MATSSLLNSFMSIVDELESGQLTPREKYILTTAIWAGTNASDRDVFEHLTRVTKIILGPKSKKPVTQDTELDDLIKKIDKFDN